MQFLTLLSLLVLHFGAAAGKQWCLCVADGKAQDAPTKRVCNRYIEGVLKPHNGAQVYLGQTLDGLNHDVCIGEARVSFVRSEFKAQCDEIGKVTSFNCWRDDDSGQSWIGHDQVVALPEKADVGFEGQVELRFNPYLFVSGGCDPYPAVDATGSLGGGLKPTGKGRGKCGGGGKGQVYVRRGQSHGRVGILYAYYFPKVRWAKGDDNGHRHYWASTVVWIKQWGCKPDNLTALQPVGISYTADHLKWGSAPASDISFGPSNAGADKATHPKVQIHDNAMTPFKGEDGDSVYERTLVSWTSLPVEASEALADANYYASQVPFTDANFQSQLDAAYQEDFYDDVPEDPYCKK
ncbi:NLP3 protein [Colletotrichum tabaci]|uniref:NLP3 protein n=1 Tax=Colletotrichum tabaci TaxID=1209068 RepID=A0AAV9T9T2_9PEZI